ncbi:MAG TPA: hypothetical protein VG898_00035 [Solirubrobacterales bacterium]|nr:hypothetical protein [Solirubrobacterales bacterium]
MGAAILLFGLVGTASAVPAIAKDGKIHACYRVKGKPKGALRVVPARLKHCRRGERKVAWSAASMVGTPGAPGANGTTGSTAASGANGSNGTNGTDGSTEAGLKTQIASLNLKVDGLESILEGVTHGDLVGSLLTLEGLDNTDLLGAVDAVKGLTNGALTEAVQSVPVVGELCEQNEALANQINLIAGVVGGLGLSPALEALGLLVIPTLPDPIGVACSTP